MLSSSQHHLVFLLSQTGIALNFQFLIPANARGVKLVAMKFQTKIFFFFFTKILNLKKTGLFIKEKFVEILDQDHTHYLALLYASSFLFYFHCCCCCLEPGKKSGYVLLRVEFDGSLRDGTAEPLEGKIVKIMQRDAPTRN